MSRDSKELKDLWSKTKPFFYFVALMREEQHHPTYEAERRHEGSHPDGEGFMNVVVSVG